MNVALAKLPTHPSHTADDYCGMTPPRRRWFFAYRFVDPLARDVVDKAFTKARHSGLDHARALQQIVAQAQRLARMAHLNFFQRSRLAVMVQNRLIEKGVSTSESRQVAVAISGSSSQSAKVG